MNYSKEVWTIHMSKYDDRTWNRSEQSMTFRSLYFLELTEKQRMSPEAKMKACIRTQNVCLRRQLHTFFNCDLSRLEKKRDYVTQKLRRPSSFTYIPILYVSGWPWYVWTVWRLKRHNSHTLHLVCYVTILLYRTYHVKTKMMLRVIVGTGWRGTFVENECVFCVCERMISQWACWISTVTDEWRVGIIVWLVGKKEVQRSKVTTLARP